MGRPFPRGGEEQGLVKEMGGGGMEENQKTLMLLVKGTVWRGETWRDACRPLTYYHSADK